MIRKLCGKKSSSCLLLVAASYLLLYMYSQNSVEKRRVDKHQESNTVEVRESMHNVSSLSTQVTNNTVEHMEIQLLELESNDLFNNFELNIPSDKIVTYGQKRTSKGFLTLGIPTVKRTSGCEYLLKTLDTLVKETSDQDKKRLVIVIFMADLDQHYHQVVYEVISKYFIEHFQSGFMQLWKAPLNYYPDLSHLKQNFGDEESRVRWRAKQVLDYAFMFYHAANLSDYYMHLEDDVIPVPNYVQKIESFIKANAKTHWVELDFSSMGYIGKLYKQHDLVKLAQFMMMFYQEQPVDWLNVYFRQALAQKKAIVHKDKLFNHIGLLSSFEKNKNRKVGSLALHNHLPQNFNTCLATTKPVGKRQIDGISISSSMKPFREEYGPESCYNSNRTFFWAVNPSDNDTLSVVYDKPVNITSISVRTGSSLRPGDVLHEGIVSVSTTSAKDSGVTVTCSNPLKVCQFIKGTCRSAEGFNNVRCITVTVKKKQKDWIIFSQLEVKVQ